MLNFHEKYIKKILQLTKFDTPTKLAKYMNVPRQRVNQYKHKGFKPRAKEIIQIAEILGLTIEEVYFSVELDRVISVEDEKIIKRLVEKHAKEIKIPSKFMKIS